MPRRQKAAKVPLARGAGRRREGNGAIEESYRYQAYEKTAEAVNPTAGSGPIMN